jgi:hypothetical protein
LSLFNCPSFPFCSVSCLGSPLSSILSLSPLLSPLLSMGFTIDVAARFKSPSFIHDLCVSMSPYVCAKQINVSQFCGFILCMCIVFVYICIYVCVSSFNALLSRQVQAHVPSRESRWAPLANSFTRSQRGRPQH